jgi:adenosylmethionine---8-amino-7-oxononanoate aminotransferase
VNWIQKDKEVVWHPFTSLKEKYPVLLVEKADKCTIHLENGKELIDAVSSWWTNIHGHANKELINVLSTQAAQIDHVIFAGYTHKPAIQLAMNLLRVTENNFKKVFFSDDGSTAVEVGLKIALQFWSNIGEDKYKVLALEGGYHGDTFGSMSLAGKSDFFKAFNDKLFQVDTLDFPTEENIESILSTIRLLNTNNDIACIVLEPLLQGSAGMRMYSKELLSKIFKICKEQNILIVSDEVLTGFGRTGELFASIHEEIKPDIMALSKGITGGILPLGVTLINERVVSAFDEDDKTKTFYHGHSYTANPICCALANKSLELLERQECTDNRSRINSSHLKIQVILDNHKKVKTSRILGTVLALEVDNGEGASYFSGIRDILYQKAISKGVLLRPLGNILYIIPPYVITDLELERVYCVIKEILDEI